eukprot:scaffold170448_cov23-Tisochrysis_lutea.AAC.1
MQAPPRGGGGTSKERTCGSSRRRAGVGGWARAGGEWAWAAGVPKYGLTVREAGRTPAGRLRSAARA